MALCNEKISLDTWMHSPIWCDAANQWHEQERASSVKNFPHFHRVNICEKGILICLTFVEHVDDDESTSILLNIYE